MTSATAAPWGTDAERVQLAAWARDRKAIVEVGCWLGHTTRVLAGATPGTVWAVDHWLGTPNDCATQANFYPEVDALGAERIFGEFVRNIAGFDNVKVMRMSSVEAATLAAQHGKRFDMIFIDADHSYDAVCEDIRAWRELLMPRGLLCGHDYRKSCSGVRHAVDELVPARRIGPDAIWWAVL